MAEQIQFIGPSVHQDVVARLNSGCELFRVEFGTQLSRLKDVPGKLADGGTSIRKRCRSQTNTEF